MERDCDFSMGLFVQMVYDELFFVQTVYVQLLRGFRIGRSGAGAVVGAHASRVLRRVMDWREIANSGRRHHSGRHRHSRHRHRNSGSKSRRTRRTRQTEGTSHAWVRKFRNVLKFFFSYDKDEPNPRMIVSHGRAFSVVIRIPGGGGIHPPSMGWGRPVGRRGIDPPKLKKSFPDTNSWGGMGTGPDKRKRAPHFSISSLIC